MTMRIAAYCVIVVVVVAASGWWILKPAIPELPDGVSEEDYQLAAQAFRLRYNQEPDAIDTFSWLAETLVQEERLEAAVGCFALIPVDHSRYGVSARHQAGQVFLRLLRVSDAEKEFRKYINAVDAGAEVPRENYLDACKRLRYILEVELRFEEREQLLKKLHDDGLRDSLDTVLFCFPGGLRWNGESATDTIESWHRTNPSDHVLTRAVGRFAAGKGELEKSISTLERCRAANGDDLLTAGFLAASLEEVGDTAGIDSLFASLPSNAPEHPWLLQTARARMLMRNREFGAAIECLKQLTSVDSTSPEAWSLLAICYRRTDQAEAQADAEKKTRILSQIGNRIGWSQIESESRAAYVEVAELALEAGFLSEAVMMADVALIVDPDSDRAKTVLEQASSGLKK